MKAKLGSEAGMQCKPNEFLLQLNAEWSSRSVSRQFLTYLKQVSHFT
jgi:hypothetical protein